ncbi:hypothetical protein L208DRAFT_82860 [Tricholoma matsutake]|nr:hypothetical protein L208DRAFT_82860 [Tricholoma matsutake 945]
MQLLSSLVLSLLSLSTCHCPTPSPLLLLIVLLHLHCCCSFHWMSSHLGGGCHRLIIPSSLWLLCSGGAGSSCCPCLHWCPCLHCCCCCCPPLHCHYCCCAVIVIVLPAPHCCPCPPCKQSIMVAVPHRPIPVLILSLSSVLALPINPVSSCSQQQQGMLGNAHCPVVVPHDVVEDGATQYPMVEAEH